MNRTQGATALIALLFLSACNDSDDFVQGTNDPVLAGPADSLENIDLTGAPLGIVDLPSTVDPRISAVFARYTAATTRDGSRVHLVAAPGVADELVFRTRAMVAQHLADIENPTSTVDKAAVEQEMVRRDATLAVVQDVASWDATDPDNEAVLTLFGGSLGLVGANQMIQEGSSGYVLPSPLIDSALGDTAVFVLRTGLTTAAPGYVAELGTLTDDAVANARFTPSAQTDPADVDAAYLALALDVYYGVWGHDPRGDGTAGENGEYIFISRDEMQAGDPGMVSALERFFSPLNTYPAFLDNAFAQTFEMEFAPVLPYTHRSRYLERVGIREGGLTARVNGNENDNVFVGNAGDNVFEGRGGNDVADMKDGADVVYLEGVQSEYTITETAPGIWRIEDNVLNRDGIDDVRGAAELVFADGTVTL